MANLYDTGIVQGTLLCCNDDSIDQNTRDQIKDARAVQASRRKPIKETDYLLVLSQDCDLANEGDEYIELISIRSLSSPKAREYLMHSRNYQKLQLLINGNLWELEAKRISIVPKSLILEQEPIIYSVLGRKEMQLIVDWRVGRYARIPFPDKFNQVFSGYLRDNENGLSGYLESHRDTIHDLYIRVNPMNDEAANRYDVTIVALIDFHCSPELEEQIKEVLKNHWQELHNHDNDLYFSQIEYPEIGVDMDINQEVVARPHDFSMFDAMHFLRFNLDYLCYR